MILQSLQLYPFAGTQNRSLVFNDGLNVIYGPNEAGKSTLVKALIGLLFTEGRLTKEKRNKFLADKLPKAGGDTIRIKAELLLPEGMMTAERAWGGGGDTIRIGLPVNGELNDPVTAFDALREAVGMTESVFTQVLLTRQLDLSNTLARISADKSGLHGLSQLLRENGLFETGGVDVETFKANLARTITDYFGRWDIAKDVPEMQRSGGFYHNGTGVVYEAFRRQAGIKDNLAAAIKYENRRDELATATAAAYSAWHTSEKEHESLKPFQSAAEERRKLEGDIKLLLVEGKDLLDANEQWPIVETEVRLGEQSLQELKQREAEAANARETSLLYERQKPILKQLERVEKGLAMIAAAEEAFAATKDVSAAFVAEADQAERQYHILKGKLSQKISFRLEAKTPLAGALLKGLEKEATFSLSGGESLEQTAEGLLQLTTDAFVLTAKTEESAEATAESCRREKQKLDDMLARFEAPDIATLRRLQQERAAAAANLKRLQDTLKDVLGSDTIESLQGKAQSLPAAPEKSYELCEAAWKKAKAELDAKERALDGLRMRIREWERKHESRTALQDKYFDFGIRKREMERKLTELPTLPEGHGTAEAFLSAFNRLAETVNQKREVYFKAQKSLDDHEKSAPADSVEDLRQACEEAEQDFRRLHKDGKRYLKIQDVLSGILQELDKDTYSPLIERTESYLSRLTAGKYGKFTFACDKVPTGLVGDAVTLEDGLLSAGTRDLLALAVRLGMAEFYLGERKGFLLMDDPLVNLDGARQEAAAQVLQELSREKQVIILTCHEAHAELLGGRLIRL